MDNYTVITFCDFLRLYNQVVFLSRAEDELEKSLAKDGNKSKEREEAFLFGNIINEVNSEVDHC